jgi:hypothetical protein
MRVSGNNISSASSKADGNFVAIFDGKTLNGWKMVGDGRFVIVESDAALQSDKGGGLLWYSEKEYKNFILKLDWKISDEGDNSGVSWNANSIVLVCSIITCSSPLLLSFFYLFGYNNCYSTCNSINSSDTF